MSQLLYKLKPAVNRKFLLLVAGILWSSVGVLLNWIALKWINNFDQIQIVATYIVGVLAGFNIAYWGFRNLAKINSLRILGYPEKVCVFAFQRWQMYFLVVFMMSLGIFMRSTTLIPKFLLAPMYVAIGFGLFISSFVYYKYLFEKKE